MSRAKILQHTGVESIEEAFATGGVYQHEILLKPGFRFRGYDTHSGHIATLKEGAYLVTTIEECPDDCHCKGET